MPPESKAGSMPPKSKANRSITPTSNMTNGNAGKRKQPDPLNSEMDGTTEDEEETSLQDMMANMGNLLSNLTTRMESYEKRSDDRDNPFISQAVFSAPPEASTNGAARGQIFSASIYLLHCPFLLPATHSQVHTFNIK